ncbi:hypothetical protein BU23DRAFT_10884 [Bimuria novae-zelandiae CBS 107.79]|uniref:Uncharacterized protein n=1 Tax=Bimuria novae-zelandiae CBS 107.79 TaxID=1447943 RepID=A0A6A5VT24_9PLEO|nr:hypothetical protein BU23DRAFT_10884 [Bimuria novae-zelandiae CBS 107.79]
MVLGVPQWNFCYSTLVSCLQRPLVYRIMNSALNLMDNTIQQVDPDKVPWPSIFWALITVQLSVMTQKSGGVLGYPARLRTYFRSSPIVCGFEVLHIAIRFGVNLWLYSWAHIWGHAHIQTWQGRTLFRRVLSDALIALFRDFPPDHDSEKLGIQPVENLGFVRALFFALGTLPQTIKILGFGGIPWSKTWTMLYITCYGVTETMNIFRNSYQGQTSLNLNLIHASRFQARRHSTLRVIELVSPTFTIFAVCAHACVLIWAYLDLFTGTDVSDSFAHENTFSFIVLGFIICCFWFACLTLFVTFAVTVCILELPVHVPRSRLYDAIPWPIFALMILIPCVGILRSITTAVPILLVVKINTLLTFILVFALALIFLWRCETIRRNVFLHLEFAPADGRVGDGWPRWISMAAFGMYATLMLVSALWYGIRYDGVGTTKPEWTDYLG